MEDGHATLPWRLSEDQVQSILQVSATQLAFRLEVLQDQGDAVVATKYITRSDLPVALYRPVTVSDFGGAYLPELRTRDPLDGDYDAAAEFGNADGLISVELRLNSILVKTWNSVAEGRSVLSFSITRAMSDQIVAVDADTIDVEWTVDQMQGIDLIRRYEAVREGSATYRPVRMSALSIPDVPSSLTRDTVYDEVTARLSVTLDNASNVVSMTLSSGDEDLGSWDESELTDGRNDLSFTLDGLIFDPADDEFAMTLTVDQARGPNLSLTKVVTLEDVDDDYDPVSIALFGYPSNDSIIRGAPLTGNYYFQVHVQNYENIRSVAFVFDDVTIRHEQYSQWLAKR